MSACKVPDPTRRAALLGTIAATVAGGGMTIASAQVARVDADAQLIAACAHLERIEAERNALGATFATLEEEVAGEPEADALDGLWGEAWRRVADMTPTTPAGAAALARAALAIAPRRRDGTVLASGCGDALAFRLAAWVAGAENVA